MYYVELDAKNLVNWFTANQGALGLDNNTGYTLYFSDRRGEQKDTSAAPNIKTGSFGYNDIINPNDPNNGCSNLVLDPGEDFEGDGALRTVWWRRDISGDDHSHELHAVNPERG